jgi:phytanoyl-CoA hydroxylase
LLQRRGGDGGHRHVQGRDADVRSRGGVGGVRGRGDAEARAVALPAKAGEAMLIHNYLWHRSGVNRTGQPRRAVTVCYMSAETRCMRTKRAPRAFVQVFRKGSP